MTRKIFSQNTVPEQNTAKRLVAMLEQHQPLDQATCKRLAFARRQAVAALPPRPQELQLVSLGKAFNHFLHNHHWWPSLAVFGVILILLAFMQMNDSAFMPETLDTDSSLLTSDLPPEAFLDEDFNSWLEQSVQP